MKNPSDDYPSYNDLRTFAMSLREIGYVTFQKRAGRFRLLIDGSSDVPPDDLDAVTRVVDWIWPEGT